MVGGQNGTAQDKSGQGFQGTFFLPFFASDFKIESKIERNIPIRKEWLKAWFQESMIAGFQYFKKEWKLEKQDWNKTIFQYFKIAIWNEWLEAINKSINQ